MQRRASSNPGPTNAPVGQASRQAVQVPQWFAVNGSSGFTSTHHTLEAIGTGGSLMLTNPWQSRPVSVVRDGIETQLVAENAYRLELEDASRAIRGEGAPLLGRADAMGQARALDGLLRSAATDQPVRL